MLDPWVRKIPCRRNWQPTPVFFPGKSHGQRRLEGYGPWGHKRVGHNLVIKRQQQQNVIINCFSELSSLSRKISYLMRGSWGSSIYSPLVRSTSDNLKLVTGICSWSGGLSCGVDPETCKVCTLSRQLVSELS